MKKAIQWGLFLLFSVVLWTACGSGDNDEETGGGTSVEGPVMVSTTPVDGATNISAESLSISVKYDQNISFVSSNLSKMTLTGGTLTDARVNGGVGKELLIDATLEWGKTYTLTIPKGVVTGPSQSQAEQVRFSFTTVEKPVVSSSLVNPNAITSAKKVYAYMLENYGSKVLSGSMANVNWNIAEAELVHAATGKYPAIAFFDYIHLFASPANWIDYSQTKVVEDWWNSNGLVGASWHWMVPVSEGAAADDVTYEPSKTTFQAKNVTVDGTWENRVAKADLEKMAGYLKLLQVKGIPVIWRPLHEAAGNIYEFTGGTAWFWWGYDGAESYKKLWIYMFDYFKAQGVNNLIWVWTTQTRDAAFYPGDNYVDIIGRDIYDQTTGSVNASQYSTITGSYPQKMVALSECGNVAKISAQWQSAARWSFFMPWYQYDATTLDGHMHANTAWWTDAMSQTYVLNRSQLPSMK